MMADYVENQAAIILELCQRLSEVEAARDRFRDALSRMSLVDDDMGIYMAGAHNPDGTFTPRDGFGDGWNAAVGQYGSALLAELYEMQDEGIVPDLAEAATGDGDHYGVLVAFLRRAKRAEADQERMRDALTTYGFHSSACAAWARAPWREEDRALCDCGLAAALSTPRQP